MRVHGKSLMNNGLLKINTESEVTQQNRILFHSLYPEQD